jgi:hypothetical protein
MLEGSKILWAILRLPVVAWAIVILSIGLRHCVNPASADSEPTQHSSWERLDALLLVSVSVLWLISPRVSRKKPKLERLTVILLVLLPTILVTWRLIRVPADTFRFALHFGLPSAATIIQIILARRK